jgi:hypothetical protein
LNPTTDEEIEVKLEKSHTSKEVFPCTIVDIIEGKIKRCNSVSNLLIGIWEIDADAVKETENSSKHLGFVIHISFLIRINYMKKVQRN